MPAVRSFTRPATRPIPTDRRGGPVFPGIGTAVNVGAVLVGTAVGVLVGHRLSHRTRDVVTDALGLVTLLIAASAATSIDDAAWARAVGGSAPMLIVLGSLVLGGIAGSVLGIEERLGGFGGWLQGGLGRPARPGGGGGGAGAIAGGGAPSLRVFLGGRCGPAWGD